MTKLDRIKLNSLLSELRTIKTTIQNIHADARKNSNKWRRFDYTDRWDIELVADEIKCEAKWLSEWLGYLGRS